MPLRRHSAARSVLLAVALVSSPALGEPPQRLYISSDSICPSADDVATQLAPLMPETELATAQEAGELASETVTIRITSNGLRVEASSEDKEFRELPNDCTERARMVAVFVHLKYAPLFVAESASPAPSESASTKGAPRESASRVSAPAGSAQAESVPSESAPPAPKVTAVEGPVASDAPRGPALPTNWGASLGVAALTNLDARSLDRSAVYGVSARGWIGDDWALAFGLSVLLPSEHVLVSRFATESASLTVWRTPADVALRYQNRWAHAWLYGEFGLEGALLRVSRLTAPGQAYRLEWGPRAALGIGHSFGRGLTLGASLFATFVPMPYEFRLEPRTSLGTSPAAWGGASLGLWF